MFYSYIKTYLTFVPQFLSFIFFSKYNTFSQNFNMTVKCVKTRYKKITANNKYVKVYLSFAYLIRLTTVNKYTTIIFKRIRYINFFGNLSQ